MKTRWFLAMVATGLLPGAARAGGEQFTPGHVFVSVHEPDPCDFGGREAIVEIDPATGAASVFADSDDGICALSGLRFTPDGERLLALNAGHLLPENDNGWVQEFAPDGTSTLILDQSDGLARPFGANGLAFDSAGNLYVLNTLTSTILKFLRDGGPGTVFADGGDGIVGRGALDFARNGDLFYCGDLAGVIIRITPGGQSSVFDTLPAPSSLAFDAHGNLFVMAGQAGVGTTLYRYDNADPNSRRILAQGFAGASGVPEPITLSADGTVLYFLELWGKLYAIDAEDGTRTVLTDLTDLLSGVMVGVVPDGITLYAPEQIPATSEWGIVLMILVFLTVGTLVLNRGPARDTHGLQTRATLSRRSFWRKVMKAKRSNTAMLAVMCAASFCGVRPGIAGPETVGQWGSLLDTNSGWDIPGKHMILLKDGNVLVLDDLLNVHVWERPTETMGPQIPDPLDSAGRAIPLFCSGHAQLPDGRVVFTGGGFGSDDVHAHTVIFDPDPDLQDPDACDPWCVEDDMPLVGPPGQEVPGIRWYPTCTTLPNGRILTLAGDADTHTGDIPVIFDTSQERGLDLQYTQYTEAKLHLPRYPFVFQGSDGSIVFAGSEFSTSDPSAGKTTRRLMKDPVDQQVKWSAIDPATTPGGAALIWDGGDGGLIIKAGGDCPCDGEGTVGTKSAAVFSLDTTQECPEWVALPSMNNPRRITITLSRCPMGRFSPSVSSCNRRSMTRSIPRTVGRRWP